MTAGTALEDNRKVAGPAGPQGAVGTTGTTGPTGPATSVKDTNGTAKPASKSKSALHCTQDYFVRSLAISIYVDGHLLQEHALCIVASIDSKLVVSCR